MKKVKKEETKKSIKKEAKKPEISKIKTSPVDGIYFCTDGCALIYKGVAEDFKGDKEVTFRSACKRIKELMIDMG